MNTKLFNRVLLFCLFSYSWGASGGGLDQQRNTFLQAEKLLFKSKDEAFKVKLAVLEDYPLYPYLKYQWLKKNLKFDREIQEFLTEHKDTRYAKLLRNKWLLGLAERKQWHTYIRHYRKSNSGALQCQYQWAKYKTGHQRDALIAAKQLWVVGYSQPKQCDALFSKLMEAKYFTDAMVWRRFELALENKKIQLAKFVQRKLNREDRKIADFWLRVHQNPSLMFKNKKWENSFKQSGLIFAHGIDRMARLNPMTAVENWERYKKEFKIDNSRRAKLEKRLALALAFRKNAQAYSRLNQLKEADETVREWRIRAALLEQNWLHVKVSLTRLLEKEKRMPKWQYWRARMFMETGKQKQAREIFKLVAKDRSYYGFLAADYLQQDYQFSDRPLRLEQEKLATLANKPDFRVIVEFRFFNRMLEARRQWWYAVSKLDKRQIIMAAKLAQQWQWNEIAIFTIARVKHWDDLDLRFPIAYVQQVKKNAAQRDLDPSIVFGLIRQESVFNKYARSPVGARGLMQIMPKTGKQIAKDLNEHWRSTNSLFEPALNVKYGTFYYRQMLDRFNGHFALAAAAYNAGPHRVKRWLPEKNAVPADIWIETIPFKETRHYVSTVLAYAMIYQQRTGRNSLKMIDFMQDVMPG